MDRTEKQQVVEELNQAFKQHSAVWLIDFTGIKVVDEVELRRKVAEAGSSYRVVKNTLALRAAKDTAVSQVEDFFQGPTAVAMTRENPVGLAKTLADFFKNHPGMSLKVGILDESVLSSGDLEALAKMPSREELLAKAVYLLQAPLTGLAATLQSPLRKLTLILRQLSEKKDAT